MEIHITQILARIKELREKESDLRISSLEKDELIDLNHQLDELVELRR